MAKSDQHAASLSYQRKAIAKATNQPVESYAPIARCLLVMDATQKVRMMHKFEICYVIAREGLAFLSGSMEPSRSTMTLDAWDD